MLKKYVKKIVLASSRKKKLASGENIMALTVFGLSALTKGAFGAISGGQNTKNIRVADSQGW